MADSSATTIRRLAVTTYTKYALVLLTLAIWFGFAVRFAAYSCYFQAFLIVVAGYSLAILLILLATLSQERRGDESSSELRVRFLVCGPSALAAVISVGTTMFIIHARNICVLFRDCLSFKAFYMFHLPRFALDFSLISLQFYAIILIAFLFCRLIQVLERSIGEVDAEISAK